MIEPGVLVFSDVRQRCFRVPFPAPQLSETGVGGDPGQPPFERPARFKAGQLSIGFQKYFLSDVFDLTALAKEPARDLKDSRTMPTNNLRESLLITSAGKRHQLLVGN